MLALSFPSSMPIEAVAGLQMFMYGLAWCAIAALMAEERRPLLWWAVSAVCQALAVAVALPALTHSSVAPAETLALLLASFAAALRGVDVFAKPRRQAGPVIALVLIGYAAVFLLMEHGLALPAARRREMHQILCALATAILCLATLPSLWWRLQQKFGRPTATLALLPAASVGGVALLGAGALLLLGDDSRHVVLSAARGPLVLAAVVGSALFNFSHGLLLMARVIGRLRHSARHDYLTRVLNRRAIEYSLRQEWAAHSRRPRGCLAVILVDVDHFKNLNDLHGHSKGDDALAFLGKVLRGHMRSYDHVGRWGGEEFLIVTSPTTPQAARAAAERLLRLVERLSQRRLGVPMTVSIGVALAQEDCESAQQLVDRADQALYRAKHRGRNQTCMWGVDLIPDAEGDVHAVEAAAGSGTEPATVPQHLPWCSDPRVPSA